MTLRDLQEQIAGLLNSDDYLTGGGCMAFAEDSQTVINDVATHLQQAGGIAAVVITPSITPVEMMDRGLQVAVESLTIDFVEIPELNRLTPGNITALQAAQRAILMLNQPGIEFQSLNQTSDAQTGSVTVACVFSTQVTLTQGE